MFPIKYEEPTLHRMRWLEIDGKNILVTVPLLGRGSTKEKSGSEAGVKIQVRHIPDDPTKPDWPTETIDDHLHVAHIFFPFDRRHILVASYEGACVIPSGVGPVEREISAGDQSNPSGSRGA